MALRRASKLCKRQTTPRSSPIYVRSVKPGPSLTSPTLPICSSCLSSSLFQLWRRSNNGFQASVLFMARWAPAVLCGDVDEVEEMGSLERLAVSVAAEEVEA